MVRIRQPGLLLGEWACLVALGDQRMHGFAIAKRLAPDGDIGRVWTLSRPLTYRSIDTLIEHGLIRPLPEEAGNGPNRTVLAMTAAGRRTLHRWLAEPVAHPRDVRTVLLVKIVGCDLTGLSRVPLLDAQRALFADQVQTRRAEAKSNPTDPVGLWRLEFVLASLRFVEALQAGSAHE
jgi:DNA-binding PadR family transcriptional regulator